MSKVKRILTADSNIFVSTVKGDEPFRRLCLDLLKLIPDEFVLAEPSIVYQEVCGTIARRVGGIEARSLAEQLDRFVPTEFLFECDRVFCLASYELCSEYGIYSVDALYLSTAIHAGAILVSLDDEDFVSKLKGNRHRVETYHISDFPYF